MKLAKLNKEQLKRELHGLIGNLYWVEQAKRDRSHWAYQNPKKTAAERKRLVRIKKAMLTAPPELNENGNAVTRTFVGDLERVIERDLLKKCFYIVAQGSYHLVLAHDDKRQIHTFCEGDHILVECPTEASYDAELSACYTFYHQQ